MRKKALLASALAFAACNGVDNKPALLNEPRILAVKADPPQPSFGVTTTLSTLLYQPPLDHLGSNQCPNPGTTTYKWSWCPWPMSSNTKFECPIAQTEFDQLYAGLGLGAAPSLDLGTGETATFTNPFPAQILYALCRGDIGSSLTGLVTSSSPDAGAGQSVFSCDLPAEDYNTAASSETNPIGFKVTIKVVITPACPDLLPTGFSPLVALYSLHLPTNDTIPVNQNPVLDGISATENWTRTLDGGTAGTGDGVSDGGVASDDGGSPSVDGGESPADAGHGHDGPDGSIALDDEGLVVVKRDKHVGLLLDIDISTAEHLTVPSTIDYDSKNNLTRHYEHLDFAWYAEAGDFTGRGKGETTGYLPTALPSGQDNPPSADYLANFEFNISNQWDPPKKEDYRPDTARLIVVVRDGRGGVDWTSQVVTLEPQP
jgi:hypothetical protein